MSQLADHLPGDRVLITGACSGLGLAIAKAFGALGWRIAMIDLTANEEAVAEVQAAGGDTLFYAMDVCDLAAWHEVRGLIADSWGGLDVLVNNAGIADAGTIFSIDENRWARILDINIMGVVRGIAAFAPMMKDQHAGHIVNIASMAGLFALPSMVSYNVSKAGVVSLSETLAAELYPHGIQVSCVCPHFFKTNIGESMAATATPKTKAFLKKQLDEAKVTADDVAQTILRGIATKKFMIFTHPGTGRQWLLKRLMPGRVLNQMRQVATKIAGGG